MEIHILLGWKKMHCVPQGKRGVPVYSHYLMELFPITYALNSLIHKLFFVRGIVLLKNLVKAGYRGREFLFSVLQLLLQCKLGMPRIALIKFTQLLETYRNLIAVLCKSPCEVHTKASSRPQVWDRRGREVESIGMVMGTFESMLAVGGGCVRGMFWGCCGAGYC